MSNPPLIFVIVLNYNSLEDTVCCVECIRLNTYKNLRLLVIDNASPDGGGSRLEELLPPDELLRLPRNIGYAGGNNVGISMALEARADYVLILNPDIRLAPDAIEQYVRVMTGNPEIGILSPLQYKAHGGPLDDKFEQSVLLRHGYSSVAIDRLAPGTLLDVALVLGAVMMVRDRTFRAVGGFDPLFFAYGEEEDFCRRALAKGFRIAVTLAAPAIHLRTNEQGVVSERVLFLRTKGAYLLRMKNPGLCFFAVVASVLSCALRDLITLKRNRYPFSHYPVRRWHVFLAIGWLVSHLPEIFLHRRRESAHASYLAVA